MISDKKAIRALAWSAVDRTSQQLVQLLVGILLARLLAPGDFGLMGIIMLFAGVSYTLLEGGLGQAVAKEHEKAHLYYSSVWYVHMALSALLYIVFFLLAPVIADFFQQDNLIPIIRVLFIALLFNAGYLIQHTQLTIQLNYKAIAYINCVATVTSGMLGVLMAYLHCGVWALVMQQVSYHLVRLCAFSYYTRWKPSGKFYADFFKKYGRFSANLLSTGLLNALFTNLYAFFIGKIYPIKQTGYYTQAQRQNDTIQFTFLSIFNSVSYNLFAQTQRDVVQQKELFGKIMQKANLLTIPLFIVLAIMCPSLFGLLLGEKWLPAVPYFQLLCMSQLFSISDLLCYNLLNARGHTRLTLHVESLKKTAMLLSLLLLPIGIHYTLWAYIGICWTCTLVWLVLVHKEIGLGTKLIWKNFVPAIAVGCIAGCVIWNIDLIIPQMSSGWMATKIIVGFTLYVLLIVRTYPRLFQELKTVFSALKDE